MKYNRFKKNKGVTLIELIIAMSLLGLISTAVFGLLFYGVRVVNKSTEEIDIQHETRMVLYETSDIIRYASAVFTIPQSSFRPDNLDLGWNYIGINEVVITPAQGGNPAVIGHEIVNYTYNKTTNSHDATVLLSGQAGINYTFMFNKANPHNVDSLLEFTIEGFPEGSVDEFGMPRSTLSVTTEVEARNSLQVIDLATANDPAYAIAYRNDERQKSVVGHVAMILDTSGSMSYDMSGRTPQDRNYRPPSRISILQTEANRMIDSFAQEDNIDIGLVPFATSANTPNNASIPFYNSQFSANNLKSRVDALDAVGGTNTGDGLRRAYWGFKTHNATVQQGVVAKNYLIILVDGVTTFASVISDGNRNYFDTDGNVKEGYLDRTDPFDRNGQIAGNGSSLDAKGTGYVNLYGSKLRSGNFAKTYVIGFSALSSDLNSVNDIAAACGVSADRVFRAGSQDDLSVVFSTIQQDIVNDLWFLQGPQL